MRSVDDRDLFHLGFLGSTICALVSLNRLGVYKVTNPVGLVVEFDVPPAESGSYLGPNWGFIELMPFLHKCTPRGAYTVIAFFNQSPISSFQGTLEPSIISLQACSTIGPHYSSLMCLLPLTSLPNSSSHAFLTYSNIFRYFRPVPSRMRASNTVKSFVCDTRSFAQHCIS